MRVQIHWGPSGNRLNLEAEEQELPKAAQFLVDACEERDQDVVSLQVEHSPLMRQLFVNFLCNRKFGVNELFDENRKLVALLFIYKRKGWDTGPCAENGWSV